MIKALSAIAIAAFIAAALTVLPGFAPQVEASVHSSVVLKKADRSDYRPIGKDCSQQAWPNFEPSCLRNAGTRIAPDTGAHGFGGPEIAFQPESTTEDAPSAPDRFLLQVKLKRRPKGRRFLYGAH